MKKRYKYKIAGMVLVIVFSAHRLPASQAPDLLESVTLSTTKNFGLVDKDKAN